MLKNSDFQIKFVTLLPDIEIKLNEPMSRHTSFRIGGPAEIMVFPKNSEDLSKILKVSAMLDIKPAILGAGTNILAPDAGISGVVICLKENFDGMLQLGSTHLKIAAGVTMTRAAVFAANLGLSGLEFAHGIPGTVGGGVYMNAGAYGGEISQICQSVEVMLPNGEIAEYSCDEMDFSYRHSRLEIDGGIVVSAVFALEEKPVEQIREKMQDLMTRRKASQPLDLPSAGSAFKRPVGGYAAALIDQCNLKGFAIGDAAVSQKHAGFVVNLGNATAEDVKSLLNAVSRKVFENTGITLEPEVRLW